MKFYEFLINLTTEAYGVDIPEVGVVLNGVPYAGGEVEFIKSLGLDDKEVIKYEVHEGFVVAYLK